MECSATIAILMATYNGERYLAEQIDSLLAQTCQDWHLYIHDDGSTDRTMDVVRIYSEKYPEKICILDYPAQGGACRNFLSLLEHIEAQYYMFCDQDDVWETSKIEMEFSAMKEVEERNEGKPIIVNSDLTVVDADLQTIHPSFWKYRNIYPNFVKHFEDFAAINVVTGSTMLLNQQTKDVIHRPYTHAMMHDAWITLCATIHGGILRNIKTPTVLYRQHGNNTIGALDAKLLTFSYRLRHISELTSIFFRQFRQLNAISHVSMCSYIWTKIRYKRYISKQVRITGRFSNSFV